MSETTISTDQELMTLVNVFTVDPDHQQDLVDLLAAAGSVMAELPGFISANVHRSNDGKRVVNYVQWRSTADYQAMSSNPRATPHMQRAADLATFDPIFCTVVHIDHA